MKSRITDHTLESLITEYKEDMEKARKFLHDLERKYADRGASIILSRDDAARTMEAIQLFETAATQYFVIEDNFSQAYDALRPAFIEHALTALPAAMKCARKTMKLKKPKIKKKHGLPVMPSCGHCMHSRCGAGGYWCGLSVPEKDEGPLQLGPTNGCAPPKECPLRRIEE